MFFLHYFKTYSVVVYSKRTNYSWHLGQFIKYKGKGEKANRKKIKKSRKLKIIPSFHHIFYGLLIRMKIENTQKKNKKK